MLPELHTAIPGPASLAAAERLRRHESRNVTCLASDYPIFWQRARGTNVWDVDENRYLDWTSAFGVAGLGHTAEPVHAALVRQAGELLHAMGDVHPTPLKADVCSRLSALTFERWGAGDGKVTLGNSGFEAVEAALKTALLATGKPGVITFSGGYHGLGYGALGVIGMPFFREPFAQQLKSFQIELPFPAFPACEDDFPDGELEPLRAALEEAFSRQPVGAILVEPVQGRGGERVPPKAFLPLLRECCDRHGALLILDEIYTGLNRTGRLFACEHSGVVPDLICLGKALTGGFPLSACVGKAAVMDAWPESQGEALHTSTFLGHPVGCAMALASLEEHARPETALRVAERGATLKKALRTLKSRKIAEVRGLGLLIGLELTLDGAATNELVKAALREGLIFLQSGEAGNTLAFTPPFAVSDEEIAYTIDWLRGVL